MKSGGPRDRLEVIMEVLCAVIQMESLVRQRLSSATLHNAQLHIIMGRAFHRLMAQHCANNFQG